MRISAVVRSLTLHSYILRSICAVWFARTKSGWLQDVTLIESVTPTFTKFGKGMSKDLHALDALGGSGVIYVRRSICRVFLRDIKTPLSIANSKVSVRSLHVIYM